MNRKNKAGGGVAIYVSNKIKFKMIEKMAVSVDNLLECVAIEII